jgi:hypothetical protein
MLVAGFRAWVLAAGWLVGVGPGAGERLLSVGDWRPVSGPRLLRARPEWERGRTVLEGSTASDLRPVLRRYRLGPDAVDDHRLT